MARDAVEVIGVTAVNKGAELMLHAVAQQRHGHFDGRRVALAQWAAAYDARCAAGVHQRVWFEWPGRLRPFGMAAGNLVPERVRAPFGLVAEREVAAVLDASGFAYSDEQRVDRFADRVALFRRWRRQGKRIVLLPQAFGPFGTPQSRSLAAALLDVVDLVFARDERSHAALADLGGSGALRTAPDFTNLVHVEATAEHRRLYGGRVAVVPNFRMIDRLSDDEAASYRRALLLAFRELDRAGMRPFALIVNAKKDPSIVAGLEADLGRVIELVEPANALDVKRILGVCHAVVASRFHALVSSLAQGVPALAAGWSHKYPALMADYGSTDLLIDLAEPASVTDRLAEVVDPRRRSARSALLQRRGAALEQRSHEMWRTVAACLRA